MRWQPVLVGAVLAISTAWAQEPPKAVPVPSAVGPPASKPVATQPNPDCKARIEVSPEVFDFGEVWQGMPAEGEFTVKNTGSEPLTMDTRSSCGCTVATKPKSPLDPGETTKFTISYSTARPGDAHKKVTITSNDPTKATIDIDVKGKVKPVFAVTPTDNIVFQGVETTTVETQTVKLENKYSGPVNLKLKEGQDFGKFGIEFKEVTPGQEYELVATTKPPLDLGFNRAAVVLETGLEKVPTIMINVSGNAQPRVLASPPKMYVTSAATQPTQQMLRIQYRADKPLKINEVKATPATIKTELMPANPSAPGSKLGFHQISVTLPPFTDLPDGAKIEVLTDDEDPQFQKMEIPIQKRTTPSAPTHPIPRQLTPGQGVSLPPGVAPAPAPSGAIPTTQPVAPGKPADGPGGESK